MAEHTTVFVTGPAGTGTRTYTEQGKALSIIATQLQADTQYQADAEYERPDGTVIQTTQSVQFRTLPAGTATISNELWVTSGTSSTIFKCNYTSTYAASSVQVELEGTRYQGYLSGGTITVSNLPYYSPGTQKTFQIYLIDVYTEEIVIGRIMTLQTGSASISNLDCTLDSNHHAILTYNITSTYGVQGSSVIYNGQTYNATVSGGVATVDLGTIPAGTTITFDVDVVDNYGNRYTIANQTVTVNPALIDTPFYIELDNNSHSGSVTLNKSSGSYPSITMQISYDNYIWSNYTLGDSISLDANNPRVYFKALYAPYIDHFSMANQKYYFNSSTYIKVGGDISSLKKNSDPDNPISEQYDYDSLFLNCKVTNIDNLYLIQNQYAATCCYQSMFEGCTSLTSIPSGLLPATTFGYGCYQSMFKGCTSLRTVPSGLLPATTCGRLCYRSMFEGCTSLRTVPSGLLPATTLVDNCYNSMFKGCTSLISSPILPAKTLPNASDCYDNMFNGCSSLQSITCLAEERSGPVIVNWVQGVAASGTFYKSPNVSTSFWGTGSSGIPSGWTVQDYSN